MSLSRAMLLAAVAFASSVAAQSLTTIELTIKGHRATAEIAATEGARTVGLMHRFSLRPDHGMLFVFDAPQPLSFWMKDTYVPLSIAFIGADGQILNIEDMAPQTERTHDSRGPAVFALEMKKGWFAQFGIAAGDRVEGLQRAPQAKD
jgi:uncharacterized membrane protein (UPF0127 family)